MCKENQEHIKKNKFWQSAGVTWNDRLTEDERNVFKHYKVNDSFAGQECFCYDLNQKLSRKEKLEELLLINANVLENAIKKWQSPEKITLYRASCTGLFEKDLIVNEPHDIPIFLSTSYCETSIGPFFNDIIGDPMKMIIQCPIGTPMAPIEHMNSGTQEFEVLLNRNSKLKILSMRDITDEKNIYEIMEPKHIKNNSKNEAYQLLKEVVFELVQ